MKPVLTEGDLRIHPSATSDLGYVIDLEQSEENKRFILPWSRPEHERALLDPDIYHAVVEDASAPVGFVIVAGLRSLQRSIELRRLVVGRKRRGYGRRAIRLIKNAAFDLWNAHRLWLDVVDDNSSAIRLYRSEGFVAEGRLRDSLMRRDGFASAMIVSIGVSGLDHRHSRVCSGSGTERANSRSRASSLMPSFNQKRAGNPSREERGSVQRARDWRGRARELWGACVDAIDGSFGPFPLAGAHF